MTRVGDFADRVTALAALETVSVAEGVALVGEDGCDEDADLEGVDCVFGDAASGNRRG